MEHYSRIGLIRENLETKKNEIEQLILNGNNSSVNEYLKKAAAEIRHALTDLTNAAFEVITDDKADEPKKEKPPITPKPAKDKKSAPESGNPESLTELALVNDPEEAKLFFEEFNISYKEITRGENKGKLRIKLVRYYDRDQVREVEKRLTRSGLGEICDHPNVFRDREDNTIVTFSPYNVTELPKGRPWLQMSDHSIYGNWTKTFVVRCYGEG